MVGPGAVCCEDRFGDWGLLPQLALCGVSGLFAGVSGLSSSSSPASSPSWAGSGSGPWLWLWVVSVSTMLASPGLEFMTPDRSAAFGPYAGLLFTSPALMAPGWRNAVRSESSSFQVNTVYSRLLAWAGSHDDLPVP